MVPGIEIQQLHLRMLEGSDGSFGREYQVGYAMTGIFLRKFMDPKKHFDRKECPRYSVWRDIPLFPTLSSG